MTTDKRHLDDVSFVTLIARVFQRCPKQIQFGLHDNGHAPSIRQVHAISDLCSIKDARFWILVAYCRVRIDGEESLTRHNVRPIARCCFRNARNVDDSKARTPIALSSNLSVLLAMYTDSLSHFDAAKRRRRQRPRSRTHTNPKTISTVRRLRPYYSMRLLWPTRNQARIFRPHLTTVGDEQRYAKNAKEDDRFAHRHPSLNICVCLHDSTAHPTFGHATLSVRCALLQI